MWNNSKYLPDKITKLTEKEAAQALDKAWTEFFGQSPSKNTLACIWAQTILETGRFKYCHRYNWGNIKSRPNDGHYWTMFPCSEIIKGRQIWFKPPHDQTKFRAYLSASDGAKDYIKFLTKERYSKSLHYLLKGDVTKYTKELSKAGYFTASLKLYLNAMTRLYNEFLSKCDSWDEFDDASDPITEKERKKIESLIGTTTSESVYGYFSNTERYDIDDYDGTVVVKTPNLWDKLKNKLGF